MMEPRECVSVCRATGWIMLLKNWPKRFGKSLKTSLSNGRNAALRIFGGTMATEAMPSSSATLPPPTPSITTPSLVSTTTVYPTVSGISTGLRTASGATNLSVKFWPTGKSAITSTPSFSKCARGPTPESCKSCGVKTAPADTSTPFLARTLSHLWRLGHLPTFARTPTARLPSKSTRSTSAYVATLKFCTDERRCRRCAAPSRGAPGAV
mmetsp:Transcript_56358/g.171648  ORF Transcript_56358/g.171648 Transcript_56358/m.171648 type:complete len:210 (-) Transcript_56358:260-889(-)